MTEPTKPETRKKIKPFNLRTLRLSLKYRPEILKLVLKMRQCIRKKNILLKMLKHQLKPKDGTIPTKDLSIQTDATCYAKSNMEEENPKLYNSTHSIGESEQNNENNVAIEGQLIKEMKNSSTQTDNSLTATKKPIDHSTNMAIETTNEQIEVKMKEAGWNIQDQEGEKSIAEQVKEAAQSALQQSGMVYVESAGMYYDYKTGYYYNSELGLYYHTDTECYYFYSDDKQNFVFHSYPDRSAQNPALVAHEKKKAKKHKTDKEDVESSKKPKRRKISKKKSLKEREPSHTENVHENDERSVTDDSKTNDGHGDILDTDNKNMNIEEIPKSPADEELEDGECSDTGSEASDVEDDKSDVSTSTASDDESIAKHHPPCMRIIVRETNLAKLKVGNLFLITKDGGTIGREGDQHTIVIRDHNVSRNHLDIRYDIARKTYMATDLGSKNGTILNGIRMSESQIVSDPTEVMHGSTIQLGETKLLCHVHPGNDTCGHCEPGLIMETQEKEKKVAYTRTCSVQKQHQLELARLKNKYAPKPLSIEATAYNDRAQARREAVGSSHHSEKTQSSDLDTFIAPENKGFKLLEKMGWSKGEGLGRDNQGGIEPVPITSNEGKAGLGTSGAIATPPLVPTRVPKNTLGPATLRLATRTKMLNPPAKAFQNPKDEEESD